MLIEAWTRLSAMADSRAKAEQEVTGIGKTIFKHLVVILRYDDPVNYDKHLRDINNWIDPIQDITLKSGKRLKRQDYYTWLYLDRDHDRADLTKFCRRTDRDYGILPIIRDVEQIHTLLGKIYATLADKLATNDFVSIQQILD